MRLAVCDPNYKLLNAIREELKKIDSENFVYCYSSFDKLLAELGNNFDAVIINTEIEDRSGIEVALEIKKQYSNTEILFLTQYGEKYAQMIFYNVNVLRPYAYFVKPINRIYFQRVMRFLEQDLFKRNMGNIAVRDIYGNIVAITLNEISYIEHLNRISYIYKKDGKRCVCRKNIAFFEKCLPKSVFCHSAKSCIVNLDDVRSITGAEIKLKSGAVIYTSRAYKIPFRVGFESYRGVYREEQTQNDLLLI